MTTEENRKNYPEVAKLVDEFRAEGVPVKVLNLYRVEPVKGGFSILRQDKSAVNNIIFPNEIAATAYLDRLVSMGYCDKGTWHEWIKVYSKFND